MTNRRSSSDTTKRGAYFFFQGSTWIYNGINVEIIMKQYKRKDEDEIDFFVSLVG